MEPPFADSKPEVKAGPAVPIIRFRLATKHRAPRGTLCRSIPRTTGSISAWGWSHGPCSCPGTRTGARHQRAEEDLLERVRNWTSFDSSGNQVVHRGTPGRVLFLAA